jgi:hypothetical protein
MNKLILTFEILKGVDRQAAFSHAVDLATKALEAANIDLINPMVGIEIKEERASAAVQVGPLEMHFQEPRLVCNNSLGLKVPNRPKVKGMTKRFPLFPRG